MTPSQLLLTTTASAGTLSLLAFLYLANKKNMLHWLPAYFTGLFRKTLNNENPKHIIFCFVDHYEPRWGGVSDMDVERRRVKEWEEKYPDMAHRFVDADGFHPKHSFFFPAEEYEAEHLEVLRRICSQGLGEIEIHLHHDDDTAENLANCLTSFASELHERFGALSVDPRTGELRYAFIHGNWVLDNSGQDGRWCGVNNEITVLRETGCYADFTFPSAPHPSQPQQINSLYYATDDPALPKSHNRGVPLRVDRPSSGDLMMITGPLTLNWRRRKMGLLPRIENADIRSSNPPTNDRVDAWVNAHIHVEGRPEWVFIKVHTHGAPEREAAMLLGEPIRKMHSYLRDHYNDGGKHALHYVSSREMYNIAKAAEAGNSGNPNDYRDFVLPKPHFRPASSAEVKMTKNSTSEESQPR
jgi:hypothetical protein